MFSMWMMMMMRQLLWHLLI